ncbi:MAG: hypothetical protein KDD99_30885, partial [Bacteroidetes bacterium]|nr:hypothetical protein [Bacteroidota bacterium]
LYVEGVSEKGNDYDTPWRMMSRINTNMSWRLQVEIDEIPDAIDPAYAHLFCDRVEQVYKFRIQMSERLLGSKRQPIPVIIHGPNEELPHSMVERLKLEYQSVLINPEKTVFPDRFHSGEIEIRKEFFLNGGARFYQRIEDQFRKAFDLEKFAPEELIRRHRNNKSIFITHSIFGTLSKGEIDIFTNYINRFWSIHLSKQDPDIILFLVFTDLKEDTGGILNIFRSDPFQKMIDNLNINQGITLSRLSPVSREDVAVWQRENLQERTDLVNKIFGNKKELPMNVIQPLLRKAIEDKGNRKGKMK